MLVLSVRKPISKGITVSAPKVIEKGFPRLTYEAWFDISKGRVTTLLPTFPSHYPTSS